jgi:hypothetical protein
VYVSLPSREVISTSLADLNLAQPSW